MDAARWHTVRHLFDQAVTLDLDEASAWLARACAGDERLRAEVDALLAAHRAAGDFIETPAVDDALKVVHDTQRNLTPGDRVGPYTVIREIGRGGMGVVYLAAREDAQFRQRVALKLIKRGLDTDEILHRFLSERQILASLNHPHIARLFDGGTTEEGRPYFVMEYVDGLPLVRYCDDRRLSTRERLRLLRTICAAVQHAHQKLVIHRDLKPSNILVSGDGAVKLLDFGVAKLLDPEQPGAPTLTREPRVMTPQYASPEQVRGELVTTSTDVYSLGVILFELLTGARPYRLRDTTPEELSRVICDSDPLKPSEAVSRRSSGQNGEATRLPNASSSSLKYVSTRSSVKR